MVRALSSHQCGLGSIPGLCVICGLSLLLVLVLAPRGFSPGIPVFPSPQKPTFLNSNSIWKCPQLVPCAKSIYLFIYSFIYYQLIYLPTLALPSSTGPRRFLSSLSINSCKAATTRLRPGYFSPNIHVFLLYVFQCVRHSFDGSRIPPFVDSHLPL